MITKGSFIKELLSGKRFDVSDEDSLAIHNNLYKRYSNKDILTKGDKIKLLLIVLSLYIQFDLYVIYISQFMKIPRITHFDKKNMFLKYSFKKHGITVTEAGYRNAKAVLYFSLDGCGKIFFIQYEKPVTLNYDFLSKTYKALSGVLNLKG